MIHTRKSLMGASLLLAVGVLAHNVYIEPQFLCSDPVTNCTEADWSWESPFEIGEGPAFPAPQGEGIMDSQVLYAYVEEGGVDVLTFKVKESSIRVASINVLAPACNETRDVYPATCLIGPGLPKLKKLDNDTIARTPFLNITEDGEVVTNSAIPREVGNKLMKGKLGIAIKFTTPEVDRAVFVIEDLDDRGWYLPEGLTQDCLMGDSGLCKCFTSLPIDCDGTIVELMTPDTTDFGAKNKYYIATWNPDDDGAAMDACFNIGFLEGDTATNAEQLLSGAINESRHDTQLHTTCTPVV